MFFHDERVLTSRIEQLEKDNKRLRILCDLLWLDRSEKGETYKDELHYIFNNGISQFPYRMLEPPQNIKAFYDKNIELVYVLHNEKKLYYPKFFDLSMAENNYRHFRYVECNAGGNYIEKTPHKYVTESFTIEDGDILVDIGCAEALLSLDKVEKAKHLFLVEGDNRWIPALEATFSPWRDKVTIINKYVGNKDSDETVSLSTLLSEFSNDSLFVKMDIEGAEVGLLEENSRFFASRNNIKVACCTYHNHDDYNIITRMFREWGYTYETSDGYILLWQDENIQEPYFRRGLIRARK